MDTLKLKFLQDEKIRLQTQLKISIEIINPDLAAKYMKKNLSNGIIKNRKIHNPTVLKYVDDMIKNRWKIGAPLVFDINGYMIDGQTRCTAIIKSGESILALVIRGVDPDTFDAYDSGKKRTHADVLTTLVHNKEQLVNARSVASGINTMDSVRRQHMQILRNRTLTNTEIAALVKKDFDYYDYPFKNKMIGKWRNNINKAVSVSILAGFYYTHKKNYGKDVDVFFNEITNNTSTSQVVAEFRDMVLTNSGKKSDEKGYLSSIDIYRLIEFLFKYSLQKNSLAGRKHFASVDLKKLGQ